MGKGRSLGEKGSDHLGCEGRSPDVKSGGHLVLCSSTAWNICTVKYSL